MTEEKAIEQYRQFNIAMAADDVHTLEELLAPSFTLTHMTGYVQPRTEWLNEVGNGQMHYFSSREETVAVKAVGDRWQVTGRNQVLASIHGGSKYKWGLNTVMMVGLVDGQLQVLSAVVTSY
ncbi:nuclear transport factor 2 family protein [Lactiplantibacillus herbarum]|uniref:nuclear transport factor 2 family protein n=1 Tax=Lactiplantibacillus herbarum TaxID=1670446 RepID=UPI00069FA8E7|nr:nuclear transport factor 2 family protein [Lactiplantibacillus herbarum]